MKNADVIINNDVRLKMGVKSSQYEHLCRLLDRGHFAPPQPTNLTTPNENMKIKSTRVDKTRQQKPPTRLININPRRLTEQKG